MFGRLTPTVRNLLIINVVALLLESLLRLDFSNLFALHYIRSEYFLPTQYVTYMFMHGDFYHLLFNMIALIVFGPLLESFWGAKRFLIFYMVTGIGAGALYSGINFFEIESVRKEVKAFESDPDPEQFMLFSTRHLGGSGLTSAITNRINERGVRTVLDFADLFYDYPKNQVYVSIAGRIMDEYYTRIANIPMVGASGAVFGILIAFGLLFPNTQLMLLFPPIPIRAKYLVLGYGIWTLYMIFQDRPGDNVAHFAHLGGMIFGFIMVKIYGQDRSRFY